MRLSVDPRSGAVVLSLPWRAGLGPALDWAASHRGWIESALENLPRPHPLRPGGTMPFEGEPLLIDWRPGASRTVRRLSGRLQFGGAEAAVSARLIAWARRQARIVLEAETLAIAEIGRASCRERV